MDKKIETTTMADEKQKNIEEKPLKEVVEVPNNGKTFREKLKYVRDNITVEPLLAGLIIPSVISMFAMSNLNLDKACRVNLGFGDEICESLIRKSNKSHTDYERKVQELIASIDIWKSVIRTTLPCIMIMFLGAWSDRTGKRKVIILLPIAGELMTSINNIVNVYFFYEIPVQITVFLETFFTAVTGSWVTMFLGVFSYISDITSEESRTFRVGLVNLCMTAGLPVGFALSGVMIQNMGYYGIFSLTSVLFTTILIYGCYCLDEPDEWLRKKGLPVIQRENTTKTSFFNISHIVETVNVAFRKRSTGKRTKILLSLFAVFIVYGPTMSEHHIFYLFVRNTLSWDMVMYSFYTSYSIILHSIGSMFSLTVLSRKMQLDDSLLCLISLLSKFVGSIWTAFAKTTLELYLVPLAEILNGTTFTSLRSIISKSVDRQEIAKVNSLFSLTETLAALLFNPFYSWLYMRTLSVLPGTVFLTSAAMVIPAAIITITFYVQHRVDLKNTRKNALEAENKKEEELKKHPLDNFCVPDNVVNKKDTEK